MTIRNDTARCPGVSSTEDGVTYWREGCEDCLRRTAPTTGQPMWCMEPPPIVVFECEYRIEPARS